MRLDTEHGARFDGCAAILRRFPIGPVLGITPFNFPLNLVAHKVAPVAGGWLPDRGEAGERHTDRCALRLAEFWSPRPICRRAPYQVLPVSSSGSPTRMSWSRIDRYRKISPSRALAAIGWYLKGLDPKKRVTLELGGNAGVIVHSDADLDLGGAADRLRWLLPGRPERASACSAILVAIRGLRTTSSRDSANEAGGAV